MSAGKISAFIITPVDVRRMFNSPRTKEELVKFFQDLYKPKSQFEQERVEYNQINILAEYQMYNMIFAKNEMMYDDIKTSVLLDILWRLLEFEPEEPIPAKREGKHVEIALTDREEASKTGAEEAPKFIEENGFQEVDTEFEHCLQHKFAIFKGMIL